MKNAIDLDSSHCLAEIRKAIEAAVSVADSVEQAAQIMGVSKAQLVRLAELSRSQAVYTASERDAKRFWAHVKKGGVHDCWIWTGPSVGGYGRFQIGDKTRAACSVWLTSPVRLLYATGLSKIQALRLREDLRLCTTMTQMSCEIVVDFLRPRQ